jgi:hypothetical protein
MVGGSSFLMGCGLGRYHILAEHGCSVYRSMDSQYKRHTEVAFSLKIGIPAIPTSPVKLQSFFILSDYCVVLLWWRFFGTLVFPSPLWNSFTQIVPAIASFIYGFVADMILVLFVNYLSTLTDSVVNRRRLQL